MSRAYTIEVESRDGEPIDLDGLRATLRAMGFKMSSWAPGYRMTAKSALKRAVTDIIGAACVGGILTTEELIHEGEIRRGT